MVSLLVAALIGGDFTPYTKSFIKDSQGLLRESDLDGAEIVFKELEYTSDSKGVIGYCYAHVPLVTRGIRIEIDPSYWRRQSEIDKWQLMYHELGHCLCDLEHTNPPPVAGEKFISVLESAGIKTNRKDWLPGNCPVSLMDPYTLPEVCVLRYQIHYVKELFGRCKPVLPNSFWMESR